MSAARQRERTAPGGVRRAGTDRALSIQDVKAILASSETPDAFRFVLQGDRVELTDALGHASADHPTFVDAGSHPAGTVFVRFVGDDTVPAALVQVRRRHFYDDINAAYNILRGNDAYETHIVNVGRALNASMPERALPAAEKLSDTRLEQIARGLPEGVSPEDAVIPVFVTKRPDTASRVRAASERFLARMSGSRGAGKSETRAARDLVPTPFRSWLADADVDAEAEADQDAARRRASAEAFRAVSQLVQAADETAGKPHTQKVRQRKIPPAVLEDIDRRLSPWLLEYGENLTPDEMDTTLEWIVTNMTKPDYAAGLFRWAEGQTGIPAAVLWPFVRWVGNLAELAEQDEAAVRRLAEIRPEGMAAFQITPADMDKEIHWCQCDRCQRWRVVRKPVSDDTAEWYCGARGMDLRGMPEAQAIQRELDTVRERLRPQVLPEELRKKLQAVERELCTKMCDIAAENTDEEARERLSQYFSAVIENPPWMNLVRQADDYIARMEPRMREAGLEAETAPANAREVAEEAPDEKVSRAEASARSRLRKGLPVGIEARGSGGIFLGGEDDSVRDMIDSLEDFAEQRQTDIRELTAIEQRTPEEQKMLEDFINERRSTMLRILQLRERAERDPTVPTDVTVDEREDVEILRALRDFPDGAHYARDVTPAITARRTAAGVTKRIQTANQDSIHRNINPRHHTFLGARNSLGAGVVMVADKTGYYVLRDFVRSADDVERLVNAYKARTPNASDQKVAEVRKRMNDVLVENEELPYILGGLFLLFALHADESTERLEALAREYYPALAANPDLLARLMTRWTQQVQDAQQKPRGASRSREEAILNIQRAARQLEKLRKSGDVRDAKGMRAPWWLMGPNKWMVPVAPARDIQDPERSAAKSTAKRGTKTTTKPTLKRETKNTNGDDDDDDELERMILDEANGDENNADEVDMPSGAGASPILAASVVRPKSVAKAITVRSGKRRERSSGSSESSGAPAPPTKRSRKESQPSAQSSNDEERIVRDLLRIQDVVADGVGRGTLPNFTLTAEMIGEIYRQNAENTNQAINFLNEYQREYQRYRQQYPERTSDDLHRSLWERLLLSRSRE